MHVKNALIVIRATQQGSDAPNTKRILCGGLDGGRGWVGVGVRADGGSYGRCQNSPRHNTLVRVLQRRHGRSRKPPPTPRHKDTPLIPSPNS
ncbi:hypothetical protein BaRGS_00036567 [Batillaria attramentaria]|uniref:Uncharacterized protein n=1 Tax=Batillaria attramentaria TaxID=370345 RepID=A0ABD0JBR4_9CAEN